MLPSLNFYTAVKHNLSNGRREVCFNIKRGPQPNELFLPPQGTTVQEAERPRPPAQQ